MEIMEATTLRLQLDAAEARARQLQDNLDKIEKTLGRRRMSRRLLVIVYLAG
jgi:hypothetical protein